MGDTTAVAEWIAGVNHSDIPTEARKKAKEVSFDVLGTMLAGSVQPLGKIIIAYNEELGRSDEATIVGTDKRSSAPQAAFVNGTLGHALDFDDTGAFGHDAAILLPSLLALAEKYGGSGQDLVDAYVVGFEVGYALGNGLPRARFHKMPFIGRLGAAAACCKFLNLDAEQIVMALGISGTMASGLVHNHGTMTKPLHGGLPARDGIMAAELAMHGWTAGDRVLEHPLGLMSTIHGDDIDVFALIENLGNPYRIHNVLGIKKYPCGAGNHPTIEALLSLMTEFDFDYRDVEEVEIQQSYASDYLLFAKPKKGLEGKFSVLYNAAAALVQGKIDIDTFTDERVADPTINEMMDRIRVGVLNRWEVGLQQAERNWPKTQSTGYNNRPVVVRLKDGRTLVKNVLPAEVLGSAKNPWDSEAIRAKFEMNARLALSEEKVQEASRIWSDIDEIKDLREVTSSLVP